MKRKTEKCGIFQKNCLCLGLAGTLIFSAVCCLPAYADSPVILGETLGSELPENYTAADGNQIPDERLQDQVIEYDELGSLIHAYNLNIQEMKKSTDTTCREYTEIRDYLKTERAGSSRDKDEAKDDGDMEDYAESASLEAIYRSSASSYNDMIRNLNKYSANKSRIAEERQLTYSAQNLMISWQSIDLQKESLEKLAETYQAQYENTLVSQSAGMATEQEVTSAYNNWQDTLVSLESTKDNEASVFQSLCLILGVDGDGMELERIPSADVGRISEINLDEDTRTAVNNNTDLISERTSTSDLSTAGLNKKNRAEGELEEKISMKMKQLYEEVMQAKQAYDAAETGYASAELRLSNADQKYGLGMLSHAEYLEEQVQYIQKKTVYESADLALFQALQTYDWAVLGIVTLD